MKIILVYLLTILIISTNIEFSASQVLQTISLNPTQDNTLYESGSGNTSNGTGDYFWAGNINQPVTSDTRRGLLKFDIAGNIPAGAIISGVSLVLNMSMTPTASGQPIDLHVANSDWGEGNSNASGDEEFGAAAAAGDATWIDNFFGSSSWNVIGGDFNPVVSATKFVTGIGFYVWNSNQMETDVQNWLDNPSSNYGYLIKGNEVATVTAKRFDTKDNASTPFKPLLTINYTLPCSAAPIPFTTNVGLTTATLNWTAVQGASSYEIQGGLAGFPPAVSLTIPGASTFLDIINLDANTSYDWQIKAICSGAISPFSVIETFTTICNIPVPASTIISGCDATLTWTPVAGAIGYLITGGTSTNPTAVTLQITGGGNDMLPVTSLSGGINYVWTVQAFCSLSPLISSAVSPINNFVVNAACKPSPKGDFFLTESTEKPLSVNVYPNPGHGNLWLDIENPDHQIGTIEVHNLVGEKVVSRLFDMDYIKLDTELLIPGAYIVNVNINGKQSIHKWIKF